MKDFNRLDRLSSQMKRELSEIITTHSNLPQGLIISVIDIEVSRDLRVCKVFYSVFGGDEAIEKAQNFLSKYNKSIRMELAHRLSIRITPELRFNYDASLERGQRINELLDRIKHDDEQQ